MLNFTWEICTGLSDFIIKNFQHVVFFEQKEINAENLIYNVQNCIWDKESQQLSLYKKRNQDKYNKYWKQMLGEDRAVPQDNYYIKQYIEQNNLQDEYNIFIIRNNKFLTLIKDKEQIRQDLVSKAFSSIFNETRYLYVYIYRQKDRKGILAKRKKDFSTFELSE